MFDLTDIAVGDFVTVEVVNKRGDRNLDGARLSGVVKELVPGHNMARLESGWCVHTKDRLVEHRQAPKEVGRG